jgi:hypothetical protein
MSKDDLDKWKKDRSNTHVGSRRWSIKGFALRNILSLKDRTVGYLDDDELERVKWFACTYNMRTKQIASGKPPPRRRRRKRSNANEVKVGRVTDTTLETTPGPRNKKKNKKNKSRRRRNTSDSSTSTDEGEIIDRYTVSAPIYVKARSLETVEDTIAL